MACIHACTAWICHACKLALLQALSWINEENACHGHKKLHSCKVMTGTLWSCMKMHVGCTRIYLKFIWHDLLDKNTEIWKVMKHFYFQHDTGFDSENSVLLWFLPYHFKKKDSHKGTDSLSSENLKFEINFIFSKVNWYCKKTAKHFSFHSDTEFNLEDSKYHWYSTKTCNLSVLSTVKSWFHITYFCISFHQLHKNGFFFSRDTTTVSSTTKTTTTAKTTSICISF